MQHRTLFLSDVHLGTPGCQAGMLLDFLDHHQADTIYLIGDIIDAWRLKRGWFFPPAHDQIVQYVMKRAHEGARIFYIPGNHDELLRNYLGTHFGGIEVMQTATHVTADGRKLLITHGDQFDNIVVNAKWLAHVGDRAYEFALWLNTWVNRVKRLWGGQYWSLSNWAKQQVKQAVSYISEYERVLTDEARRHGFDGIVCGHIHSATISEINGLDYVNTGDWVESCTAVVEHEDGSLHLIDWVAETRDRDTKRGKRRSALVSRIRSRDRTKEKQDKKVA